MWYGKDDDDNSQDDLFREYLRKKKASENNNQFSRTQMYGGAYKENKDNEDADDNFSMTASWVGED